MPIYDYACECGHVELNVKNTIDDRKTNAPEHCGKKMTIKIGPTQVNAFFFGSSKNPGYLCPETGEYVSSARQRRGIMDKHNLVPVETSVGDSK